MAEEPLDLRFLGEQIKRVQHVQGDMRVLKADVTQLRADQSRVEGELAGLMRMDAFAESVTGRFDQATDLAKSNFRILDQRMGQTAQAFHLRIDEPAREFNLKIDQVIALLQATKR